MTTDELIMYLAVNIFDVEIIRRSMLLFFDSQRKSAACVIAYSLYYAAVFAAHWIGNTAAGIAVCAITIGYIASVQEGKFKTKIAAAAFTLFLMYLCEFAVGILFAYGSSPLNSDMPNLSVLFVSKILNFSVVLIIGRRVGKRGKTGFARSAAALIPISTAVLMVIVISSTGSTAAILLSSVIILFLNVIVFYLYDKLAENYDNKLELERIKREKQAYYERYAAAERSREKLRTFRHDINNQLEVIGALADRNDIAELKRQIRELISSGGDLYCYTGNTAVDGILNYKLGKLKRTGAEIKTELAIPVQNFMSTRDITVILGNLLDNAIEALSVPQENGCCYIQIKYVRGCLVIHIKNTYKTPVICENGSIASVKPDGEAHGIGLKSVQDIVGKYDGQMEIAYDERFFSVKAILPLPPENDNSEISA